MAAATTAITAGLSAAGAGASFSQAITSNRLAKQAEEKAAKFIADAKRKLDVNYMEGLQVPVEAYEIAQRQNLAQSQQATQGLRESGQREVIGGTGRVVEAGAGFSEQMRTSMQGDIYNRDVRIAQEESRLRDQRVRLDMGEAAGAQQAMADQEVLRADSIGSAFGSLSSGANDLFSGSALYGSTPADRAAMTLSQQSSMTLEEAQAAVSGLSRKQNMKLSKQGVKSDIYNNMDAFAPFRGDQ